MHAHALHYTSEAEWLELRRGGIGGSDVGAIVGLSPYKTAVDVWMEKMHGARVEESELMRAGKRLEPVICDIFSEEKGYAVEECKCVYVHPEHSFLRASVDRLILPAKEGEGMGILEAKFATGFVHRTWTAPVPLHYYAQLQHYFGVTGLEWGYFALLIDGYKFKEYRMRIDRKFVEKITERLCAWWQRHVVEGIPPAPAIERDTDELYSSMSAGKIVEADDDTLTAFDELKRVRLQIKEMEERKSQLNMAVKASMQDAETLIAGETPLASWRTDKNGKRRFRILDDAN